MPAILNRPKIEVFIDQLLTIPDEAWYEFLFQRELLKEKIPRQKQQEMQKQAVLCGKEEAIKLRQKMGELPLMSLLEHFGVSVSFAEEEQIGDRLLLALYDEDHGILVMKQPLERFVKAQNRLEEEQMLALLLSHELFHHLECQQPQIYTQATKWKLWSFWKYTYYSPVRGLSEIAAMSFAKELVQVAFSPCILEILLVWSYNQEQAWEMYEEVQSLAEHLL